MESLSKIQQLEKLDDGDGIGQLLLDLRIGRTNEKGISMAGK